MPFRFTHDDEVRDISLRHHIGVNESNAHLAAAVAGMGIIQTFRYSVGGLIEAGSLVEILSKWRPPHYPFYVVYPQNRHVTQRLKVFIAWLAEVFPEAMKG